MMVLKKFFIVKLKGINEALFQHHHFDTPSTSI